MPRKSIKLNAMLNAIKSSLSILFPLISYPYVLRVLGTHGIGKVSFVTSIVGYFSLIAMLGVSTYAVREGAKIKDNKEKISEFVSEVFTINIITTILAYILMFIMVLSFKEFREYFSLFCIIGLSIITQTLAIDWINTIFEDFYYITIRSIVVYIIQLFLIFALVKNNMDYYIYSLLLTLSPIAIFVTNWIYCRKYIKIKLIISIKIKRHLKPLIILFANTLAVFIYVNFDIIMLGFFKGDESVGLYTASARVYSVIKSVLISVYAVVIPRLAFLYGNKLTIEFKKLFSDLWNSMTIILFPIGIGLCCVSEDVIMLLGGREFYGSILSLRILSLACIAAIYGGLITSCLNIVICEENTNLFATILASLINIGLNLIFIPAFAQNGAAVTTLIAELFVVLYCYLKINNKNSYFNLYAIKNNTTQVLISSIMMTLFLLVTYFIMHQSILRLIVAIIGSPIIYGGLLLLLKNTYILKIKNNIKNKISINN